MDYYSSLGLQKGASASEIKKAFRKKAMKFHPDKNPGNKQAEAKFKEINEAYEILSDPEKKSLYDNYGKSGLNPRNTQDFYRNPTDAFEDMFSGFGDFFGRRSSPAKRGSDIHVRVLVSLKEIVNGTEKQIHYQTKNICSPCNGTGSEEPMQTCRTCGGTGKVQFARGFMNLTTTCNTCMGTGKVIKVPCRFCKGKGYSIKNNTSIVNIPKGIKPGQRLKVDGAGNRDSGHDPGDLYVDISYAQENFEIHGSDISTVIEIDCINAMLGCDFSIKTIDGYRIIKIPSGIQEGNKIKIPSQGIPVSINSNNRGNLYIVVKIKIPKNISNEMKVALERAREQL